MFLSFCNAISSSSILVIDDELPILNMLKSFLTRNDFMVDIAGNGEEGIKRIESKNYALILTDIKMPGISGDQVHDYMRNKMKKSTPIIGMSGTPWLLDQSNFDAVLSKPCSMKETLAVINQLITESS